MPRTAPLAALLLLVAAPALGQDGEPEGRFRSYSAPDRVPADEPFGVYYEFENRSEDPWSADLGYGLSPVPPTDAALWAAGDVSLRAGEEVAPGERKVFAFTVRAPTEPGTYPFSWQLTADGEAIGELPPGHTIEVLAREPGVDYEPIWFRRHQGDVEVHKQRPLVLRSDDGQPIFLTGKSALGLLAERGPATYLKDAKEEGYNMVRVYLLAPDIVLDERFSGTFEQSETGWPWETGPDRWDVGRPRNQFWNRLDTLMKQADERGMIVELVLFTAPALTYFENPTVFDEVKQAYVRQVIERLGDRTTEAGSLYQSRAGQAYLEVAEEYTRGADGPGPYPHDGLPVEFVREVAEFIRQEEARIHVIPVEEVRRLITVSAPPSDEPTLADEPWNSILNLHLPKTAGWETRIREVMLALRAMGKPLVDDRSVGTGPALPEDERDDDVDRQRFRMWAAAMAGGFVTFHSGNAIPAIAGPMPGASAARPLRKLFERLDHWLLEPVIDEAESFILESAADTTWATASRTQYVAYLRTSGDGEGTLRVSLPQRGTRPLRYEVRWFDPTTGDFLNRLWLPAGEHTFDLPGLVPDVVFVASSLEASRTPALVQLQPACLPVNYDGSLTLRGEDFQPGAHLLVEGWNAAGVPVELEENPVPLGYTDNVEATLALKRYLGIEVGRDIYDLYPATFVMRVRNYSGHVSAPRTLRIVPHADDCDLPAEGEGEPDAGEGEGETDSGEGEGEPQDAGPQDDVPGGAAPAAGSDAGCGCGVAARTEGAGWRSLVGWALRGGARR